MAIDTDTARKVAHLARIRVEEERLPALAREFDAILGFIEQLQAVDTEGIEPMAHAVDVVQRLRPDVATETDRRADFQAV